MTTEATLEAPAHPPADPRTICRLTPAELRELSFLERFEESSLLKPEDRKRYVELWNLLGGVGNASLGISTLADSLAAALERNEKHATIDVSFDRKKLEEAIEDAIASAQMPLLFILPSGRVVNLDGLRATYELGDRDPEGAAMPGDPLPTLPAFRLDFGDEFVDVDDPHDAAALRSRIHRLAKAIESPTLKGDDQDGDGRTGE